MQKNHAFLLIITVAVIFILFIISQQSNEKSNDYSCNEFEKAMREFEEGKLLSESTVFFVETSFMTDQEARNSLLKARQACALESAARVYSNSSILVLVLTSHETYYNVSLEKYLSLQYPNISFRKINFKKFFNGTPFQSLHDRQVLKKSSYPVHHASDILRYAILYKYQGTYLDFDIISLKPLYLKNYAALESDNTLAAGVINFGRDKVGLELANDCAEELVRHFTAKEWSTNSVGVISKVLRKRCKTATEKLTASIECRGFHVLPNETFYAISYSQRDLLFSYDNLDYFLSQIEKSYGVHVWNARTEKKEIAAGNLSIPYLYLANKYCPVTYSLFSGDFNE